MVNYRYYVSGGPERYMFNLTDLLERAGHEVIPFSVSYDMNEPTPYSDSFVRPIAAGDQALFRQHSWTPAVFARAMERTFYSREVYDALTTLVQRAKPDVAIVLHYLRKLSPSVLTALRDAKVPCVVRLSDYGMVCAESHMTRNGVPCADCAGGALLPGVLHSCVQGSAGASVVNAAATTLHRMLGWYDIPYAYVAPSAALRAAMLECYGWPGEKVRLLPTFVPERPAVTPALSRTARIAYVGRVDPLKGIDVLLEAYGIMDRRMGDGVPRLVIAGGAAKEYVVRLKERAAALGIRSSIEFRGDLKASEVLDLLGGSMVSVVPSICVENLPNSLLESLACGTPVVASDTPSIAEVLDGSDAGILVPAGDPVGLADALERVATADPDARQTMQSAAEALAREVYSPGRHLARLSSLLEEAAGSRRA